VPARFIQNRIVIIGSSAPSLRDLFLVPQSRFTSAGARQMQLTGMELHANLAAGLVRMADGRPHPLVALPGWSGSLLLLLGLALGGVLGESFATLRRSILTVGAVEVAALAAAVGLLLQGIWVQTSLPLAGLALMAGAAWLRRGSASQQQRQQIQRLLGQSTSPAVAQQLWEQRDELLNDGRFEGRVLPVTTVFSDTCNFTTVSESLSPADLLAWLNRGMALCVPAITQRAGKWYEHADGRWSIRGGKQRFVFNSRKRTAECLPDGLWRAQRGLIIWALDHRQRWLECPRRGTPVAEVPVWLDFVRGSDRDYHPSPPPDRRRTRN
jgi:adenylate cyclase